MGDHRVYVDEDGRQYYLDEDGKVIYIKPNHLNGVHPSVQAAIVAAIGGIIVALIALFPVNSPDEPYKPVIVAIFVGVDNQNEPSSTPNTLETAVGETLTAIALTPTITIPPTGTLLPTATFTLTNTLTATPIPPVTIVTATFTSLPPTSIEPTVRIVTVTPKPPVTIVTATFTSLPPTSTDTPTSVDAATVTPTKLVATQAGNVINRIRCDEDSYWEFQDGSYIWKGPAPGTSQCSFVCQHIGGEVLQRMFENTNTALIVDTGGEIVGLDICKGDFNRSETLVEDGVTCAPNASPSEWPQVRGQVIITGSDGFCIGKR